MQDSDAKKSNPLRRGPAGGNQGWTFILLSVGIALIACCVLIPQADENRRLFWEAEKLRTDLEHLHRQVEVNAEFVKRVGQDPALTERLAQRQMKYIREGTNVLELKDPDADLRSPFVMVSVPPPPPMPEYRPVGGRFAELCRDAKARLYMIGGGLMLLAMGLVLGHTPER